MGFISMVIVFIGLILFILSIMLFVGLILLRIGIIKKRNPKNKGKKHPIVFIATGLLLALPAVVLILLVLVTSLTANIKTSSKQTQYECVPDKWRNERVIDRVAAQEVLDALLESADDGDKEAFALNFTPEIQEKLDFDDTLDEFFVSYPEGFSDCDIEVTSVGGESSYSYGHNVQDGRTSIDVMMNGEWYKIELSFCYENTDNPDGVGVTEFTIRNLNGEAYFESKYSENSDYFEDEYLICSIMSEQEAPARMISGKPYLWTDTSKPKLTEDEMRELLNKYRYLGIGYSEVCNVIGEPNAHIKYSNSTGYDYYYELAPAEDGTPQYVHICTGNAKGWIIDAYLCDSEKTYYDNPIVEH